MISYSPAVMYILLESIGSSNRRKRNFLLSLLHYKKGSQSQRDCYGLPIYLFTHLCISYYYARIYSLLHQQTWRLLQVSDLRTEKSIRFTTGCQIVLKFVYKHSPWANKNPRLHLLPRGDKSASSFQA